MDEKWALNAFVDNVSWSNVPRNWHEVYWTMSPKGCDWSQIFLKKLLLIVNFSPICIAIHLSQNGLTRRQMLILKLVKSS
jgi:hypothetical protein